MSTNDHFLEEIPRNSDQKKSEEATRVQAPFQVSNPSNKRRNKKRNPKKRQRKIHIRKKKFASFKINLVEAPSNEIEAEHDLSSINDDTGTTMSNESKVSKRESKRLRKEKSKVVDFNGS